MEFVPQHAFSWLLVGSISNWLNHDNDHNGWDPLTNRAIPGWSSQMSLTHQTGATDQLVLCFEELDASAQLPPRDLSCALWICTDLSKGPGATGLQFHESQCFLSDRDHRCPRPTGEWNKRNPVNEWWQMDLNDHGTWYAWDAKLDLFFKDAGHHWSCPSCLQPDLKKTRCSCCTGPNP